MNRWTTQGTGWLTSVVDLAGVATLFRSSDEERASAIDAAIGALPPHPGPTVLEVSFDTVASAPPHGAWAHADGDVRASWNGNDLLLGHGSLRAHVGGATAHVGGQGDLARGFRQLLPYVATHLLAGRGLFVLHGGAIQRSGRAAVVLGGSGSGKSTLVVSAFRAGWGVLGDDLVAVRIGNEGSGAVEVTGIAKPVLAPADVVGAVGLPARPADADPRDRWEVDVGVGGSRTEWYPVTATLVSTHGKAAEAESQSLTSEQLIEWLLFSYLSRREPERLRGFLPVAAAITSRPGWVIRHSNDPASRAREAEALLRRLPITATERRT